MLFLKCFLSLFTVLFVYTYTYVRIFLSSYPYILHYCVIKQLFDFGIKKNFARRFCLFFFDLSVNRQTTNHRDVFLITMHDDMAMIMLNK